MTADQILQGGRDEEKFLPQAQLLPGAGGVGGIEDLGDRLGADAVGGVAPVSTVMASPGFIVRFCRMPLLFSGSAHHAARDAAAELAEYFAGRRRKFTVPLAAPGTPFQMRVWAELNRIPYGETISYETLAEQPGRVEQVRFNITIPRATNTPPANAKSPATDPKKK